MSVSVKLATSKRARVARRKVRELNRVRRLPPYTRATTDVLGFPMEIVHGMSFYYQHRAIFEDHCYDVRFGRADPYILDCGANIGLASVFWKRLYPAARIVAFEADPVIARTARRNLEASGAGDVEVIPAAAWIACGTVRFTPEGGDAGRLGLGTGSVNVPSRRVRDWLDEPVDLLKLDIEGAEVEVLLDCADRLCNVQRVALEYHSMADRPQELAAILHALSAAGLRLTLKHEYASKRPMVKMETEIGMDLRLNIYGVR